MIVFRACFFIHNTISSRIYFINFSKMTSIIFTEFKIIVYLRIKVLYFLFYMFFFSHRVPQRIHRVTHSDIGNYKQQGLAHIKIIKNQQL